MVNRTKHINLAFYCSCKIPNGHVSSYTVNPKFTVLFFEVPNPWFLEFLVHILFLLAQDDKRKARKGKSLPGTNSSVVNGLS
jgi:hypothetical protein